jgi:hypothetical protein
MDLLRRAGLAIAVIAVTAFGFTAVAAAAQKDPPKFYVRDKEPELGTFYEGVDIEYDFIVINNGVSELHILGVRPG